MSNDEPRNARPLIGCVGKVAHPDFVEATKAAKRTNRSKDSARVGPYRCTLCRYWHLGSHDWGLDLDKRTRAKRADFQESDMRGG